VAAMEKLFAGRLVDILVEIGMVVCFCAQKGISTKSEGHPRSFLHS